LKRRWWTIGIFVVAAALAVALWPSSRPQAGYPFARRVAGAAGSALWKLDPAVLDKLTADDAERLAQFSARLKRGVEDARANEALLKIEKVEDLKAEDRSKIRELWYGIFEPLVALDGIKKRYDGWFGVDYMAHPALHARAFGLSYAALCAQVEGGQAFLDIVSGKDVATKLFDEEMMDLGLPRGTFSAMRTRLSRARDYSFVPAGAEWFDLWIDKHLSGAAGDKIRGLVSAHRAAALARLAQVKGVARTAENKAELLKTAAFQAWFPVQKELAEWAGDTRIAPEGRRLISDEQLKAMKAELRPGDILIERRNWYLSNVGLPGFWPHAALFSGSQEDIKKTFDADEEVKKRFGTFSEHLAKKYPKAWQALGEKDSAGHSHTVIEAVSEGVVAASFEHSCGADYVAALRPTFPLVEVASAIDRALGYFGRPYDFDFDFATDDRVVCSELVVKAYEAASDGAPGLKVPWVTVAGRRALPPTELVRLFARERGAPTAQLQFVYYLEGNEATKKALKGDASALARTPQRPKWDVAQP